MLAGGQSLIPMLKLRFASPEMLVDINNIPGLDYHRVDPDGTIRVGALCRHADLERSTLLASRQPTMAAAAPLIADPIVRNRGTLVGSLCHADPQGDWASVVTALGGHVVAQGPSGRRTIPVAQFVTGPFQNVLAIDEVGGGGGHTGAGGRSGRGLPQAGAPRRRLRDCRRRRRHRELGRIDLPGGDRADRRRWLDHRCGRRGASARRWTPHRRTASGRPQSSRRRRRGPTRDHRGSAEFKRHIVRTFVVRILTRVATSAERAA